ncbi:MAG: hypothetical protein AAFV19_00410 [Pseudomonadota bacterium]
MTRSDHEADGIILFSVRNETKDPLKLWIEPGCEFSDLAPDTMIDFRASIMGDTRAEASQLAEAFENIAKKLRGGEERGAQLEIILNELNDGTRCLTLWLDNADELGYGDVPTRSSR